MRSCPSFQQLEQLLEEQLNDVESRAVELHVVGCPSCQAALERLTADTTVGDGPLSRASLQELVGSGVDSGEASLSFLTRLKETHTPAGTNGSGKPWLYSSKSRDAGASSTPLIPGFEILSELGRGGMGVVYKARQLGLNRLVALKMILAGSHAGEKGLSRFRQEAEAIAGLRHPNIVQIYDIGESEGVPYLVLELVEEGSLVQRIRGDPQVIQPTVRLLETLARAIHFAHQHQVVHRDLKPANILLQAEDISRKDAKAQSNQEEQEQNPQAGNSPSDPPFSLPLGGLASLREMSFIPKITDFGLAKRLDEQGGTQTGEVVGTPSYMAPEQASGKGKVVGPAADVYALGVILYEMLTGRPPFKGPTALDTLVQVINEEPVRPSRLRLDLPRDLETICLKCLSKEPARRYPSAAALADDLQRFRHGKPIEARPVGLRERAWKWTRRRPVYAALLAGMFLVALVGFAGITWQWQEATLARDVALEEKRQKETQRQQAEQARGEAIEERKKVRTTLYYSRILQSQLQWGVNDVTGARHNLAKCLPLLGEEDRRGWEWYYLHGLFHANLFTLQHPGSGAGGSVAFHPDGRCIAAVVGGDPADEHTKLAEICFWDAKSGQLIRTLVAPRTTHRLAFRSDGERLALGTTDGKIMIRDATTGKELLRETPHTQAVTALAFSPNGQALACASWDQTVKVCNSSTGQVLHVLKGHTGPVQAVTFHPRGRWLASGSWDNTVKLWDVTAGKEVLTLRGHKSAVYGVAFSPDGEFLASAGSNGNLKIWEVATGKVVQSVTGQTGAMLGIAFSPDGRYLASGGSDATVRIWQVDSGVERTVFRGHTAAVESLQFSPDSQRLASCSPAQGVVKVWDLTQHPEYATFARTGGRVQKLIKVWDLLRSPEAPALAQTGPDIEALAFQAEGKRLVCVTVGGKVQTWDAATGVLLEVLSLPVSDELFSPAVLAAFNPRGSHLAARTRQDDRLVKVWDVETGASVATLKGHTFPVFCVRFSGDGRRLVTCGCAIKDAARPQEVKVWDLKGENLVSLSGNGQIFSATFSPDGRWLALAQQDGVLALVDWAGSQKVHRLVGHKSSVAAVAFNPQGELLASAGMEDKTVNLWEVGSLTRPGQPPKAAHTLSAPAFLCDLSFSPDGRRLAGISRDLVKLWDVGTGHEVLTLRGAPQRHWDPAFNPRVTFSPDGKRLVGTNWDESISIWEAERLPDDNAVARHQAARRQAADARAPYWHLQEAEDCLEQNNPAAARFHLNRVGSVALPAPLHVRKERLQAQLKTNG
jgi:WD40 repeat protein/serine/threonine protein kinase